MIYSALRSTPASGSQWESSLSGRSRGNRARATANTRRWLPSITKLVDQIRRKPFRKHRDLHDQLIALDPDRVDLPAAVAFEALHQRSTCDLKAVVEHPAAETCHLHRWRLQRGLSLAAV